MVVQGYICSNADAVGNGRRAVDLLQPWLDTWSRKNKDKVGAVNGWGLLVQWGQVRAIMHASMPLLACGMGVRPHVVHVWGGRWWWSGGGWAIA